MFEKVLIANRGEIAVRIIHACRELGIETVAVYSTKDKDSLHVQIADQAVCIGPKEIDKSYLNMKSILAACEITGAKAVHPGCGFLAENKKFAKMVELCGLKFIGPSYKSIDLLGDKIKAKQLVKKIGVPVVEGSQEAVKSLEQAEKIADLIGYPIIIKAKAGGGGKGIRIVFKKQDLNSAFFLCKAEAKAYFADEEIYIEKYIQNPRHVEVQILADEFFNIVHLAERDCSVQRRNQKLIEEAKSPAVDEVLRKKLGAAAVKVARAAEYFNAGTVEFLLDKDKNFYFMEMNTRVQVEHGITELISGVDIVKTQIKIAAREKLKIKQKDLVFKGHSIECRINAEAPEKGFMPTPGQIKQLHIPCGNGIRVDHAIYSGYFVPPYYDNMLAKLMVFADTREEAIFKMISALAEFIIFGISTNIDFHLKILRNKDFKAANVDIGFLERLGY